VTSMLTTKRYFVLIGIGWLLGCFVSRRAR